MQLLNFSVQENKKKIILIYINFFKKAVREVLTSDKAGGHIILVTQGDAKTLSSAGEASIEEYEATHGITFSSILLPLVPEQKPLPFYQSIADR